MIYLVCQFLHQTIDLQELGRDYRSRGAINVLDV